MNHTIPKRTGVALLAVLWVLLLPALSAAAQTEKGEANITPQTTMADIRANPSIIGSGIYTYGQEQEGPARRLWWQDKTLKEFVNRYTAEDTAAGLNRVIENYNAGIQITYPLYTQEEIAQQPTRAKVELYYFPGQNPGGKYALIVGGNALCTTAELREGISTAARLNQLGYTAFVLRYRVGEDAENNAPLQDVARAVQYITAHTAEFNVQPENYALIGYSSGGQIVGVFASEAYGYRQFGTLRPGALLLGYPVNSFFEVKFAWGIAIDSGKEGTYYYDLNVSDCITPDYPPVYHWNGKNDALLALMCTPMQGSTLEKALQKNGVPHVYHLYENAPHSVGAGRYTDADGWLDEAVAFWEQQTAA